MYISEYPVINHFIHLKLSHSHPNLKSKAFKPMTFSLKTHYSSAKKPQKTFSIQSLIKVNPFQLLHLIYKQPLDVCICVYIHVCEYELVENHFSNIRSSHCLQFEEEK